jgi:hypothetical protein
MQAISSRPMSVSKVPLLALGLAVAPMLALLVLLKPAWLPVPGGRLASETSTVAPTVAAETANHQTSERSEGLSAAVGNPRPGTDATSAGLRPFKAR